MNELIEKAQRKAEEQKKALKKAHSWECRRQRETSEVENNQLDKQERNKLDKSHQGQ